MLDDWGVSTTGLRKLIGLIIAAAIAWQLFDVMIQPVLVSISPLFADQYLTGTGAVGRTPDTLAQAALFVTLLIGMFVYLLLDILIFDGVDNPMKIFDALYLIFIIMPYSIIDKFIIGKLTSKEDS